MSAYARQKAYKHQACHNRCTLYKINSSCTVHCLVANNVWMSIPAAPAQLGATCAHHTHCPAPCSVQLPVTVGRKVPLVPQVAVGLPVKPGAHTAVHVLPATVELQAMLHPLLLLGGAGNVEMLHTAQDKDTSTHQSTSACARWAMAIMLHSESTHMLIHCSPWQQCM